MSILIIPIPMSLTLLFACRYAGKKIIVGVDVCQRLSGGSLKLAAYEQLLTDYSSTGQVVLIQV